MLGIRRSQCNILRDKWIKSDRQRSIKGYVICMSLDKFQGWSSFGKLLSRTIANCRVSCLFRIKHIKLIVHNKWMFKMREVVITKKICFSFFVFHSVVYCSHKRTTISICKILSCKDLTNSIDFTIPINKIIISTYSEVKIPWWRMSFFLPSIVKTRQTRNK